MGCNNTYPQQEAHEDERLHVISAGDLKSLLGSVSLRCPSMPACVCFFSPSGAQYAGWAVKKRWTSRTSLKRGVFQGVWSCVRWKKAAPVNQPLFSQFDLKCCIPCKCVWLCWFLRMLVLFFQKALPCPVLTLRVWLHPQSALQIRYKSHTIMQDVTQ